MRFVLDKRRCCVHHRHIVAIAFEAKLDLMKEGLREINELSITELELNIDVLVEILGRAVKEGGSGGHRQR